MFGNKKREKPVMKVLSELFDVLVTTKEKGIPPSEHNEKIDRVSRNYIIDCVLNRAMIPSVMNTIRYVYDTLKDEIEFDDLVKANAVLIVQHNVIEMNSLIQLGESLSEQGFVLAKVTKDENENLMFL